MAKPLHVGHLRSAIIGEQNGWAVSLGHRVIGDVHLGDWGLQMGLIITELKKRSPELVYFDESYEGNIRRHRLLSASWRKVIPQPAVDQKKMRIIKMRLWRLH